MDNNTDLLEAGKASYAALQHARPLVKEGAKLLDVAESVESLIMNKGLNFSFPINISINEKAAHYTPTKDDASVFKAGDLVKVDIGARKGDSLGDCAITVDVSGTHAKLVEASEAALNDAISAVKAGVEVCKIGAIIEKAVIARGAVPIRNLGGHGITHAELHADIFIPNFDNGDTTKLEEGQVISIEPFVTDGAGYVQDSDEVQIFQKISDAAPRSREARQVQEVINKKYLTYPFAIRWLETELGSMSSFGIRRGLQELLTLGALESFPVLVERKSGFVAQTEKELIVEKEGCTILTQ